MSAETLRQAAALIRERAEAAPTAPWSARPFTYGDPANGPTHMVVENIRGVISEHDYDRWGGTSAEHIASWHPAVALVVADLLDNAAYRMDQFGIPPAEYLPPLAVARAYLGEGA